jgi:diguanylate cyclase (GGDEF)-like protein
MHDPLTDLPNRALLLDLLDHALARAARSGRPCALLFIDLDRFKRVNDTLGHAAGDQLLKVVATRLRQAIRPGDSASRLGGDEFVVLAEEIEGQTAAEIIAERARDRLAQPVHLGRESVTVSCSIGIALSAGHSPEGLLQEADIALYRAKQSGRNRWAIYDQALPAGCISPRTQ